MDVEIADDVILLGRGVDHVGLVLREVDQVDAVLFRVEGSLLGAFFAVVDDDLVVLGAGDEGGAVGGEVEVVDGVLVVLEDLAHSHRADNVVHQLHVGVAVEIVVRSVIVEGVSGVRDEAGSYLGLTVFLGIYVGDGTVGTVEQPSKREVPGAERGGSAAGQQPRQNREGGGSGSKRNAAVQTCQMCPS